MTSVKMLVLPHSRRQQRQIHKKKSEENKHKMKQKEEEWRMAKESESVKRQSAGKA